MSRGCGVVSDDFRKQVLGYGLTTAQILYRMPDHPSLLQTYVWQNYDLFPKFPALKDFLAFWQEKLEGPLYSVTVAHSKLIKPAELRAVDGVFQPALRRASAIADRTQTVANLPCERPRRGRLRSGRQAMAKKRRHQEPQPRPR